MTIFTFHLANVSSGTALGAMFSPPTASAVPGLRSIECLAVMKLGSPIHGRDAAPGADRHAVAMVERNRRDFHTEFTTLRFRALSEHGAWEGRTGIVPRGVP